MEHHSYYLTLANRSGVHDNTKVIFVDLTDPSIYT